MRKDLPRHGIDYSECSQQLPNYAYVVVNLDWTVQQLDLKNAFLNGHLEEEVYMEATSRFVGKFGDNVCKLKSCYIILYSLPELGLKDLLY